MHHTGAAQCAIAVFARVDTLDAYEAGACRAFEDASAARRVLARQTGVESRVAAAEALVHSWRELKKKIKVCLAMSSLSFYIHSMRVSKKRMRRRHVSSRSKQPTLTDAPAAVDANDESADLYLYSNVDWDDTLAELLANKRAREVRDFLMRRRVHAATTAVMDTGIRVNRGLAQAMLGPSYEDNTSQTPLRYILPPSFDYCTTRELTDSECRDRGVALSGVSCHV
jgi:hypothetical protein